MRNLCGTLLALALTLGLAGSGLAQNVMGGVKVGVGFADLGGDIEDLLETSTDIRTGFSGGAFLGTDVGEMFHIQGNAQYVLKGAKASEGSDEITFKLTYVELYVPFTFLIPVQSDLVRPRLFAGPSLAFELSCKVDGNIQGQPIDEDCDGDLIDAPTNSTDFGIVFGGGVDVMAGSGAITIDALYNLGLANIADDPNELVDVTNKNIQLLVGYAFFW